MTAIRKFNSYCERLDSLYDPSWGIPLPAPLPTKLTKLCNDPRLMEDVWITPSVGEVPRWLEDSHIRDGIRALLKRDQCEEEQIRLSIEADNLCHFFGEAFAVPLQQQHANFVRLQSRWSNSLASPACFVSQVNKALDVATTLSGASRSTTLLSINSGTLVAPDPEGGDEFPLTDPDHSPPIDSEQAALADVLEGQVGILELDDDDDSTDYGREANAVICWDLPENLLVDDFNVPLCIPMREPGILIPGKIVARVRPSSHDGIPRQIFDPRDIGFLSSPTACLNDLKTSGAQCAILSTHDLPHIRYNAPDNVIWHNSSWVRYWEKDIWVLPIHRPLGIGHWVLCVIRLSNKELHLFDSLGNRQPWQNDVKDIMRLIAWFLAIACQHQHRVNIDLEGWVARPLNVQCVQNNDFDCGVWVLATIFAVVRSKHIMGVLEQDMVNL
ncbi:uncharacterized protein EDB91DRAFT_1087579 [Suillus paluster]|uniref:uncharacterized protein n=1 Tax=Suillus paluster TaxID=48578 RepID=UPI001B87618C|nr:uncharacterized protein EDB91DRAFT_1087579 [Suillus paluster]KAG1724163.1 hypothetical protein EDB91DRAFT_1087579 [Suillus paluster]